MILIDAIRLHGYKSYPPQKVVFLGPLASLNEFIGANNSGKSNILRYIPRVFSQIHDTISEASTSSDFQPVEVPYGHKKEDVHPALHIGLNVHGARFKWWVDRLPEQHRDLFESLIPALTQDDYLWFCYEQGNEGRMLIAAEQIKFLKEKAVLTEGQWQAMSNSLPRKLGGRSSNRFSPVERVLHYLTPLSRDAVSAKLIPEVRIGQNREELAALAERLATLKSPGFQKDNLRNDFFKLRNFLRTVLGISELDLDVSNESTKQVMVEHDNRRMPLASVGSGIRSLITIGIECATESNQLVFIEEPELHLHPAAQRSFLNYLVENTTNQYFVTTHSASIIDLPNASAIHVRHDSNWSSIDMINNIQGKVEACRSIGYRPSDLMQTNCIVWVEGPSDVIYFRWWMKQMLQDYIEGLHYSFMTYGGSLIAGLDFESEQMTEDRLEQQSEQGLKQLINICDLNRFCAVILDSDKLSTSQKELKPGKERILSQFENGPGFARLTQGKEIENYIPPIVMKTALQEYSSQFQEMLSDSEYETAWKFKNQAGKIVSANKVELANIVCRKEPTDYLDLAEMRKLIFDFVVKSNRS